MMMADQNWDQELHEKQEALQDALRQVKSLLVDTGLDDEDEADVGNLINYQFNQIITKETSLQPPSKNLEIKTSDKYIFDSDEIL